MTATDLQQYDVVRATFRPRVTDDLKPGGAAWIGRRLLWEVLWRITAEDGGPYVGQWAMGVHEAPEHRFPPGERPPFLWVPFSDLAEVEPAKR